jgi:UPF0755 protein
MKKEPKAGSSAAHVLARGLGALAAILVLAAGAGTIALFSAAEPGPGIGSGVLFTVDRGDNARTVAAALESEGYIRSALAFRLLAKAGGLESSLKAGTYRILPGMGAKRILDEFVSGKQALVRFTLPEGFTLSQAASLLERLGIAPKASFLEAASSPSLLSELAIPASSAEGYLFPDTYFFPAAFSGEGALRAMVKAFREKIATIPEASALSPRELHDRIIMASVVEREYKVPEEAPMMASVFYNRLKIRMALQSCATVVYVITERLGKPHPDVIYDRDLKLPDPYNTYVHPGLPPGPISNPGLTSLRAAFYPATSRYLYFRLVDAEAGRHHFSSTLEEHIDAQKLFIKKVVG